MYQFYILAPEIYGDGSQAKYKRVERGRGGALQ